jgi:ATP-dependent exoDNAse (exonuclease V) beta subunit
LTEPPAIDSKRNARHSQVDLDAVVAEIEQAAAGQHTSEASYAAASYAAPIPCDPSARRRFSISRLSCTLDSTSDESDDSPPAMLTTGSADQRAALALGTLVHATLAGIDPAQPGELAARVALYGDKLRITDESVRDVAQQLVERFLNSTRAADLRRAKQVYKEIEFLLAWPPLTSTTPIKKTPQQIGRYLQGYLDCLYQDHGGAWHVLDYKTNLLPASGFAEILRKYEMQMLAYGLAAEQATGEPISDMVLHFMRTGHEHAFAWTPENRNRAIELVNDAIAVQCAGETDPRKNSSEAAAITSMEVIG